MGYRSGFALVLSLRAQQAMYCLLENQDAETKKMCYISFLEEDYGDLVLCGDQIKWYPSYNEIQFLEFCMEHFNKKSLPYRFLRIGEDWDDIEKMYVSGDEEEEDQMTDIHLVRSIIALNKKE